MSYKLPDEPSPGPLEHLVVQPIWPLLASMLIGPWMGWSWFLLNSTALGSPNAKSDRWLALKGLAGSFAVLFLAAFLFGGAASPLRSKLVRLAVDVWKLAVSYWLYSSQAPSLELHLHYGGSTRNGVSGLIAGLLLEGMVEGAIRPIWWLGVTLL